MLLLGIVLLGFLASPTPAATFFRVRSLGPRQYYQHRLAVNNMGQVVGFGSPHVWDPELGLVELPIPDGEPVSINDYGRITGTFTSPKTNTPAAFVYDLNTGKLTDLGPLAPKGYWSIGNCINKKGQVVGMYGENANYTSFGFFWSATTGLQKLNLGTGTVQYANAINDAGQIVGTTSNSDGSNWIAYFLASPGGTPVGLGNLGRAAPAPDPYAINNAGQVVGRGPNAQGVLRAFQWTQKGGIREIDTPAGKWSEALAINDQGVIVGFHSPGMANIGQPFVLFGAGAPLDLVSLTSSTFTLKHPTGINSDSKIVGLAAQTGDPWDQLWPVLLSPKEPFNPFPGGPPDPDPW